MRDASLLSVGDVVTWDCWKLGLVRDKVVPLHVRVVAMPPEWQRTSVTVEIVSVPQRRDICGYLVGMRDEAPVPELTPLHPLERLALGL